MSRNLITTIFLLLCIISLTLGGYFLLRTKTLTKFPVQNAVQNQEKVNLVSVHPGYDIKKGADFLEYIRFLDEIGFWRKNAISDTRGIGSVTAQKLTITLTDQAQDALPIYSKGDNHSAPKLIHSFGYKYFDGNAQIYIQVDPDLIINSKRNPESIANDILIQSRIWR